MFDEACEEPARFSVEELSKIAPALHALDLPYRIELIEGVLVQLPFNRSHHGLVAAKLSIALHVALETDVLTVLTGAGVQFSPHTVRKPDIVVVGQFAPSGSYLDAADVRLGIEVADRDALALDLGPRKLRFAAAGVPDYWVVDVEGERVRRFSAPRDGDYAVAEEQGFDAPLPVPGTDRTIRLTDSVPI